MNGDEREERGRERIYNRQERVGERSGGMERGQCWIGTSKATGKQIWRCVRGKAGGSLTTLRVVLGQDEICWLGRMVSSPPRSCLYLLPPGGFISQARVFRSSV